MKHSGPYRRNAEAGIIRQMSKPSEGSKGRYIDLRKVTERLDSSLLHGKPPSCFLESDASEPPDISVTLNSFQGLKNRCRTKFGMTDKFYGEPLDGEREISRIMDELMSPELETTRPASSEIHNDNCLAKCRTWFQICNNRRSDVNI